jgi:hypothetical protein
MSPSQNRRALFEGWAQPYNMDVFIGDTSFADQAHQ